MELAYKVGGNITEYQQFPLFLGGGMQPPLTDALPGVEDIGLSHGPRLTRGLASSTSCWAQQQSYGPSKSRRQ